MSESYLTKCHDMSINLLDILDFLSTVRCETVIGRVRVNIAYRCVRYTRKIIVSIYNSKLFIREG